MEYQKASRQSRTKKLLEKQKAASRRRFRKSDYMDERWKALRLKALDRDGWKCTACNAVEDLNVHHNKYVRGGEIWDSPLTDLVTLCRHCHKLVHKILSGKDEPKKKRK